MKVKLLKKIRRRYSITYYPNGRFICGDFYNGPITTLEDSDDSWRLTSSSLEKDMAYGYLYGVMQTWIQRDYGIFKSRKHKITSEQLWYKK